MMHLFYKISCCLLAGLLFLTACDDENKPTNLMPTVSVEEPQEVTRTTAFLTGEVKKNGEGVVTVLQFRYGISPEMENKAICTPPQTNPSVTLTDLQPNTTYYYCLEAGNGYSFVQSPTHHFTTHPNQVPTITKLQMLNQGPLSITLQYELTDNGGEPITSTGFYYRVENGQEEQWSVVLQESPVFQARISGLQKEKSYTVQAYATNSIGETRSEPFSFHTGQAVITTAPGTLSQAMDSNEKYQYASLSIAGPLNGTDIRFIREMLGKDINGKETPGRMNMLDLTDAVICSGGASYDGMRYTANNLIGYGMFANCTHLQKLLLPDNTREIEENAFKNCPALKSFLIPATTAKIMPSDSCSQLAAIEVSAGNNVFSSIDGILYDKEGTRLFWFPESKEKILTFPSTLTSIEEYAFRNCRMQVLELPSTISEIKKGAFYGAQFETIILPEQLELISYGLLQNCKNLTSVTLGKRTNYLSGYCFDGCPLQHLYVTTEDLPPICQAETFTETLFKNCTLYVPRGCLTMYRNSTYWGKFEKITERTD